MANPRHTYRRQCKGICGCVTAHSARFDHENNEAPVWVCECCYSITPRIARKPSAKEAAHRAELDRTFEELVAEAEKR